MGGQLDDLMTTLYKTEPHFIRCVVPNTHKIPGGVEPDLVMHQYKCNGVLAGIAICRMGFPNKTLYPEFKARYNIMAAGAVAKAKNDKAAAQAVMDVVKMDKEKYRLGHTKVFFRAGIAGKMEEFREDKIGSVLSWLQSGARGKASRMQFKKLQDQKLALYACQRAIRMYMTAKTWLWAQIWLAIKPNLKCTQFGKFKKEYEDKIALAEANIEGALEARSKVQAVYDGFMGQKNELSLALKSGGSAVQDIIDKTVRIENAAAVAEGAYQGMTNTGNNQSILITGESGAGKTENTKKVISYFATICSSGKRKEGEASLEDKIVATNPVLEAWGNAKTVRNDNSSRFGKFIRIHFNQSGKLSGADMVVCLLEKSRLTYQQPLERCYHAFYNIMSDAVPDLKEKCLLTNDIKDYWYVSQGKLTVPSIDDKEDMQFAHEAFMALGFTTDEEYNVYKNTAAMMHMGNMTKDFVPVGKEEQAEIKDETNAQKVAALAGIDCEWMITYFCKPKLKVGTEWVNKGSTCTNAANSVAGIARAIYERTFRIVVDKCNETLIDPTMKKVHYIGVLDIAGFEIFDYNGFEQICINYVNEKLQQFFNQHMFTLEQEEYVKEGLDWANVDFGMDLQPCINMFEKPMAFLAIFEEESLFPKATDATFCEKLHSNMLGKWPNFAKANPRPDPDAHFAIVHYAATVSYNLTGWLEKNKDPLNDTIVEMIKNGGNALAIECFKDHPGQPTEAPKDQDRKKKGGGKTVSSYFKGQLDDLMTTLYKTEPHFIRCVVPNTHKIPGGVEPDLIMHQYQCNGVLAGIAICRKGFPNKMLYPEFKGRYNILAAKLVAKAKNDKGAAS